MMRDASLRELPIIPGDAGISPGAPQTVLDAWRTLPGTKDRINPDNRRIAGVRSLAQRNHETASHLRCALENSFLSAIVLPPFETIKRLPRCASYKFGLSSAILAYTSSTGSAKFENRLFPSGDHSPPRIGVLTRDGMTGIMLSLICACCPKASWLMTEYSTPS